MQMLQPNNKLASLDLPTIWTNDAQGQVNLICETNKVVATAINAKGKKKMKERT